MIELNVKNFALIKEASITLKRLNVFIGRNASGKSYMLYLIWSLFSSEPDFKLLNIAVEEFARRVLKGDIGIEDAVFGLIQFFFDKLEEIWLNSFIENLKSTFGVENVVELIGPYDSEMRISLKVSGHLPLIDLTISEDEIKIKKPSAEDIRHAFKNFRFEKKVFSDRLSVRVYYDNELLVDEMVRRDIDNLSNLLFSGIFPLIFIRIWGILPYLDACIMTDGRAGIIRLREALTYAYYASQIKSLLLQRPDIAFYRDVYGITPIIKVKEIAEIADFIEKALLFKIKFEPTLSEIFVEDIIADKKYPIVKAPSGVRELAPLIILLRYRLKEYSALFIEEPETHLHIDLQSIITRALSRLYKHILFIILTTHSIHILDEIDNLLALNAIAEKDPSRLEKLGYSKEDSINPDDLAIYLFKRDTGEVKAVKVFKTGIDRTDLDLIMEELGNKYSLVKMIAEEENI